MLVEVRMAERLLEQTPMEISSSHEGQHIITCGVLKHLLKLVLNLYHVECLCCSGYWCSNGRSS